MAEHLVGSINVTENHNTWIADERITIFFETSDESFVVKKDDIEVLVGEILTPETIAWFTRSSTGFATLDEYDENVITFTESIEFPYYIAVYTLLPTSGINDVELSLLSTTSTAIGTFAGGLTVGATGTNTPFQYSLLPPPWPSDSGLQSTGVFLSLPIGNYTVFTKDSIGYIDFLTASVNDLTDYGTKWRAQYTDAYGRIIRIDIDERSYTAGITTLDTNAKDAWYSARGENSEPFINGIIASEVGVQLLATTRDQLKELSEGDERKYKLKKYADSVLEWDGFVDPNLYSDNIASTPYFVTVVAKDGLADLDTYSFLSGEPSAIQKESDFYIKGNTSHFLALKTSLDKVAPGKGFRIACNTFASVHNEGVEDTPLEQTYFDGKIYINEKDDKVKSCKDVIQDILKVHYAVLFEYDGYWYVVNQNELLTSSVSYKEFDSELAYVSSSTWNPQVDFGDANEANKWRWKGAQGRRLTRVKKSVTEKIKAIPSEGGMLTPISKLNANYLNGQFTGFRNWVLHLGNSATNKTSIDDSTVFWDLNITENEAVQSTSWIEQRGNINCNKDDFLRLSASIKYSTNYFNYAAAPEWWNEITPPPYVQLKWSFQLGDKYFNQNGEWSDTALLNIDFLDGKEGEVKFIKENNFFDSTSHDYIFKMYVILSVEVNEEETTYSVTNMTNHLRGTSYNSATYAEGSRVTFRAEIFDFVQGLVDNICYYELVETDEANNSHLVSRTSDWATSGLAWVLVTSRPRGDTVNPFSKTQFSEIKLNYLISSTEDEEPTTQELEREYTQVINTKNTEVFDEDLNQFSLPAEGGTFNQDKIIRNYLKDYTQQPLKQWFDGFKTKRIQELRLGYLVNLMKKCRAKINGTIYTEIPMSPKNILLESGDDNRKYLLTSINSNGYDKEIKGEFIEYSSDTTVTEDASAFTTGFKQNAVR